MSVTQVLPPETLPGVRDTIASTAGHLAAAQDDEQRRRLQRDHLATVARHIADALFTDAIFHPLAVDDERLPTPLDGELLIAEAAPLLLPAHGLGDCLLSGAECRSVAVRSFLDRLHELYAGGDPRGCA